MKRKNYLNLLTVIMVAMLSVIFVSCSKDDKDDELEQTENVSNQDPEGTIVLNMEGGASSNYYKMGDFVEIHIDAANNFRGKDHNNYKIEFVAIGKVGGLSKVNQIPLSGWAESAAVTPGTGYMMRYYSTNIFNESFGNPQYVRIYVVDYLTTTYTDETGNVYGSSSGATIKYQAPLQQKINFDNSSLAFNNTGNVSQSVKLKVPTHLSVKEKPEWCKVTTYVDSVCVTVSENLGEVRKGNIVLSNVYGEATLSVSQSAIAAISFEKNSLSFTNIASSQSLKLKTPTYYEVEEKPEWCNVRITVDSLVVSVSENTGKERTGNIIVKNVMGRVMINVSQDSYPPINLEKTSLNFSSESSSQSVKLKMPTSSEVQEKPEWCFVKITMDSIVVSVAENVTASERTGKIVLKNGVSSATLNITQKASLNPLFEKGIGTADAPYQIKTAQQLDNIRKGITCHFVLIADIDLKSYLYEYGNGWVPISNFIGTLDGKGHSISGLWMNLPSTNYIGLFAKVSDATISNIVIELGENGIRGNTYVGTLCGSASSSVFKQCSVKGNIVGNGKYVGGLCGNGNNCSISQCFVNASISCSGSGVGGLVGYCSGGSISQCSVKSSLTGETSIGGIAGYGNPCNISECFSEGNAQGSGRYSIVCGIGYGCVTTNSFSLMNITGEQLFGISDNHTKCYFSGKCITDGWFSCRGSYSYFDKDVVSTNSFNGNDTRNNARSTQEMKKQSTYENWDFTNTWKISEGKTYPTLRCFDK